jgi:hypothetical protein
MPASFTENDRMLGTAGTDDDGKKGFYPSVSSTGAYPAGATVVTAGQSGAAALLGATLGTAADKTTHISGFIVTGAGATAASVITVTLSNVVGGPYTFRIAIPAGATVGITPLSVNFNPPLQAVAANTAIVVSVPSFGVGNTDAALMAWGFHV